MMPVPRVFAKRQSLLILFKVILLEFIFSKCHNEVHVVITGPRLIETPLKIYAY